MLSRWLWAIRWLISTDKQILAQKRQFQKISIGHFLPIPIVSIGFLFVESDQKLLI
jgi:hypothetical protein